MALGSRLDGLTLTQLRTLDALLDEASVTRSAQRLGITQSAASHALKGLRESLDDPLLVRGPRGFVPTDRAAALAGPLRRALRDLEAALGLEAAFDPRTAVRTFRLGAPDSFAPLLLPPLVGVLLREAPGLDLDVLPPPDLDLADALAEGRLDAACAIRVPDEPGLKARALVHDRLAVAVRADHPEVGEQLDLDTYCRLPHALMSPTGRGRGIVDAALERVGRSRRVHLRIRYFLAAPLVVADSPLVLTGPRSLLEHFATLTPLRLFDVPVATDPFTMHLVWHIRADGDPAHRYLREAIAACLR